ncbi:hypothetical protein T4A_8852 [Trichinella pseudospiralis]|uniref:Uncharacterized protein n=1 Tax=Trichinella pseudospiralis TaxID=6337 RepID=A0A0V1EJJ8_TRIPS|nr:hypothetical protein T4A_8852 [Trichinella pseudospiralis]KRZ39307.1 hypothetical protein T4C_1661 [Trichinella pseudospiralis]
MFCIAIDSTNSTNNQPLSNTSADLHLCLLTENTGNYLTPGSGLLLVLSSLGDHCSSESTHKGERRSTLKWSHKRLNSVAKDLENANIPLDELGARKNAVRLQPPSKCHLRHHFQVHDTSDHAREKAHAVIGALSGACPNHLKRTTDFKAIFIKCWFGQMHSSDHGRIHGIVSLLSAHCDLRSRRRSS